MINMLLLWCVFILLFFFFKQKTAYEMRISDWSSDVCSSDLVIHAHDVKLETSSCGADGTTGCRTIGVSRQEKPQCAPRSITTSSAEIGRASCRERVCQYV